MSITEGIVRFFSRIFVEQKKVWNVHFRVDREECAVVDYDIPLPKYLSTANCTHDGYITEENFPPNREEHGKIEFVFKVFRPDSRDGDVTKDFSPDVSSDEAIQVMQKHGCRPATLRELIAYVTAHPSEYLVALGSVCNPLGIKKVPSFSMLSTNSSDKKYIHLDPLSEEWSSIHGFLSVSEKK